MTARLTVRRVEEGKEKEYGNMMIQRNKAGKRNGGRRKEGMEERRNRSNKKWN